MEELCIAGADWAGFIVADVVVKFDNSITSVADFGLNISYVCRVQLCCRLRVADFSLKFQVLISMLALLRTLILFSWNILSFVMLLLSLRVSCFSLLSLLISSTQCVSAVPYHDFCFLLYSWFDYFCSSCFWHICSSCCCC